MKLCSSSENFRGLAYTLHFMKPTVYTFYTLKGGFVPSDGSHGGKADQQNTHEAVDPIERSIGSDNDQGPPHITVTTTVPSSKPARPTTSPPVSPSPCVPSSPPLSSSPPPPSPTPSPLHLTPSHLPAPDGASTETSSENDFVFV
jgi:hypothetical protein